MDKNSINQFLTNLSQKVCEKRIDKHDMKTLEIISFSDEAYHRAMVAKLLVNSETKKSEEILKNTNTTNIRDAFLKLIGEDNE